MDASTDDTTILYELNLECDAADAAAFDSWLSDHVADVLQLDGMQSAQILADPAPPPGVARRSVHYRVADRAALDAYLATDLARLEKAEKGVELDFLEKGVELDFRHENRVRPLFPLFRTSARVLAPREEFQHGAITGNCLNCGEVLRGQHCGHCGQRARIRVLSLMSLLRDVLGDVLNWDSRLWRTLRPLALRPGLLTREYLLGRRTHYTPPFRMYVILSVAFFVLASTGDDLRLQVGTDGGFLTFDESSEVELEPEDAAALRELAKDPCNPRGARIELGPFQDQAPRLLEACRKIVADSQGFGRAVYQNVPRTMFAFLPLVALLMTVLYLGSGRFYVEHLLFFVHYHAFFFLGGLVIVLLDRVTTVLPAPAVQAGAAAIVLSFSLYVPLYLYLAMRRVYAEGRIVTLAKFLLLGFGYLIGLALTFLGLLIYTALSL